MQLFPLACHMSDNRIPQLHPCQLSLVHNYSQSMVKDKIVQFRVLFIGSVADTRQIMIIGEKIWADLKLNLSLSSGKSCGYISTFLQTFPSSVVSKLRTPSCLCATKPTFLYVGALLMLKRSPHA